VAPDLCAASWACTQATKGKSCSELALRRLGTVMQLRCLGCSDKPHCHLRENVSCGSSTKKYTFSALQVPLKEERALIDARVSGSQTEVDPVTANCLNYWARAHCHLNKLRKLQLRNTNLFSVLVSGAMPLAS